METPDPTAGAAPDPAPEASHHEPGLRARKKSATRAALQDAALRLVSEHGLEAVTVEQVCAQVAVSERTFFNYFSSKEEALAGPGPTPPSDAALADFESGGTNPRLLHDLGRVLARHLDDHVGTSDDLVRRHDLFQREPRLQLRFRANLRATESRLAIAIAHRLDRDPLDPAVRLLVGLVSVGMRSAMKGWASTGADMPLSDHVTAVFDLLDDALDLTVLLDGGRLGPG